MRFEKWLRRFAGVTAAWCVLMLAVATSSAQDDQGSIVGWGRMRVGVDLSEGFVAVAGGNPHSLGLKAGGSILGWGGYTRIICGSSRSRSAEETCCRGKHHQ